MEQSKFYQIKNVTGHEYTLVGCDGSVITRPIQDVDKSASAFTIQDAKDGDVLVNWNNTVFIFKDITDETVKFYIAYNEKWDAIKTPSTKLSHLGLPEPQFEFHPATKEQRDTLMKAMADAGYIFDFEKKEVRKIKQKPVENKGMNLVEEEMTPFQKKVFCIIDTAVEEEQGLKQVCDELLTLASNEIEQKPVEWSEEDELHIRELESLVKQTWATAERGNDKETIHKMSDLTFFLKTLKPQLKREWSKEDEEMIEGLNNCLDELEEDNGWYYVYVNNKNIKLNKVRNWLKSLKQGIGE